MTISITRHDLDATALRVAASRCPDVAASRRMLGLALVLDGHNRAAAARAAGMDRQTLRDWVHRYNEAGLAGLLNKPNTGAPPRKLRPEQEAAVAEWVRNVFRRHQPDLVALIAQPAAEVMRPAARLHRHHAAWKARRRADRRRRGLGQLSAAGWSRMA